MRSIPINHFTSFWIREYCPWIASVHCLLFYFSFTPKPQQLFYASAVPIGLSYLKYSAEKQGVAKVDHIDTVLPSNIPTVAGTRCFRRWEKTLLEADVRQSALPNSHAELVSSPQSSSIFSVLEKIRHISSSSTYSYVALPVIPCE